VSHTLPVPRIARAEIDDALRRDQLRRHAEEGDLAALAALANLMGGWPDYVRCSAARVLNATEKADRP